jgi:hypothetical protein
MLAKPCVSFANDHVSVAASRWLHVWLQGVAELSPRGLQDLLGGASHVQLVVRCCSVLFCVALCQAEVSSALHRVPVCPCRCTCAAVPAQLLWPAGGVSGGAGGPGGCHGGTFRPDCTTITTTNSNTTTSSSRNRASRSWGRRQWCSGQWCKLRCCWWSCSELE